MREIKFRGFGIDSIGRDIGWSYGKLKQFDDGSVTIGSSFSIIIPETVGEFTGLLDKEDKEIYEGDIVKWRNKNYVVKFWDGMFYASVEECNTNVYGGFPLHSIANTDTTIDDKNICEIIGNIYDNKELLK